MILLADSGSTKVDWCLADQGKLITQVFTTGANPFFRSTEEISAELKTDLVPSLGNHKIDAVYFFGAGCAFPDKNEIVRAAIADNIDAPIIEIGSDLLGAAKGLCGNNKGIVCIIGTGSNSCFYNGQEIESNVSPLGFILGDEGSGAVLGKLLVGACLKNQLSIGLKEKFFKRFDTTAAEILDKVYKQPTPNRYLASLSVFLIENISDKTVYNLVYKAFIDFFRKNVMQYDYTANDVHFTGSIAYYYQDVLRKAGDELNIKVGSIISSPMDGLVNHYTISK